MKITVNGHKKNYDFNLTLRMLLIDLGYANKRVAVEINEEIIPRSQLKNKFVVNGDNIEIIKAVGGG